MENDKRLERIVAKDKGYSAPRCAYCTDTIQQEDDAKFPVFPDGKSYPVHKACDKERKPEIPETLEELTERVENWTEHTAELKQELDYRSHINGKRIIEHLVLALVPLSMFFQPLCRRILYGPDRVEMTMDPRGALLEFMTQTLNIAVAETYGLNSAAGIYLTLSAIKPIFYYMGAASQTNELNKKMAFAKDHSNHLQEKLAQMPPDKADDKKTS